MYIFSCFLYETHIVLRQCSWGESHTLKLSISFFLWATSSSPLSIPEWLCNVIFVERREATCEMWPDLSPPGHERETVLPPLTSFDVCMSDEREIDISCLFPSHVHPVMSMFRYVTSCVMCLCQLCERDVWYLVSLPPSLREHYIMITSLTLVSHRHYILTCTDFLSSLGWWWWCFQKGWEKGKLPSQRVKGREIFHYRQTADSPSP